jgi:DAK2 domain fusion protein YloV
VCDGDGLLRCLRGAGAWLAAHTEQVNALNVFPVPDGDTGTNMSLTMRAALEEAGTRAYASVGEVMRVVAHGALMGARGNSGVILSQIMRGFARALDSLENLTPATLASALTEGAATAYKGVVKPVEGTILTVARESASMAQKAADAGADLDQVLESAVREAEASLARTPSLLPVLAEAGVVDAGGQGYAILLGGILRCMRGQSTQPAAAASAAGAAQVEHAQPPEGSYNYDTQFIVLGEALEVEQIRERILTLGDSVLVVGDSRTVKVHVHTDHPGQALDYGIGQGRVTEVVIENMQVQYEAFVAASAAAAPTAKPTPKASGVTLYPSPQRLTDTSVIAVVAGAGLERVFESLGVDAVVPGGQTMNPSTQELLTAIEGVTCDKVIVLPNNSNIILTAQQAVELTTKQVRVVPSKTVPQGIAALLAFNYQADAEANAAAMLEAIAHVQTAEITRAVRSAQVNGLAVTEGQLIGLLNGELTSADEDEVALVRDVLERMDVSEYEIVTLYYGQDVSPEKAEALAQAIRGAYPSLEVDVLDGGQPHYYYVISVE